MKPFKDKIKVQVWSQLFDRLQYQVVDKVREQIINQIRHYGHIRIFEPVNRHIHIEKYHETT